MSRCKKAVRGQNVPNRWHSVPKQRRDCFWALGGYQDPENKDQRQKFRTRMEPTRTCVVHTSDTNPVSCRQEESQPSVFIHPQAHLFSSGSAHSTPVKLKKYSHFLWNYFIMGWSHLAGIYVSYVSITFNRVRLVKRRVRKAGRVWNRRGEGLPLLLSHRTAAGGSSFTLITLAAFPIALPSLQWVSF